MQYWWPVVIIKCQQQTVWNSNSGDGWNFKVYIRFADQYYGFILHRFITFYIFDLRDGFRLVRRQIFNIQILIVSSE